MNSDFGNKWLI
jgi:protein gp37